MPELPEVQNIVSALSAQLLGAQLIDVKFYKNQLRRKIDQQAIAAKLLNNTIIDLRRRAKWPAIVFPNGCLWLHLGMSGQILVFKKQDLPDVGKHDHMDLFFNNDLVVRFHDPRRFGLIDWTDGQQSAPPSSPLGVEPLSNEFNEQYLKNELKKSKKPIKTFVLDGKVVVGVGNIYASEALFRSKINPKTLSNLLSDAQCKLLVSNIKQILQQAIIDGGSSFRSYKKPDGSKGGAQHSHQVYAKENQPCPICSTKIISIKQSGRSTFFCPQCQPENSKSVKLTK